MSRQLTFTLDKTPTAVGELTDVQGEQLLDAWERYSGERPALEQLVDPQNTLIEYWRITDSGKPVYDFWHIAPDSGALYVADTVAFAGIKMVQFGWDLPDVTAELVQECLALDAGFEAAGRRVAPTLPGDFQAPSPKGAARRRRAGSASRKSTGVGKAKAQLLWLWIETASYRRPARGRAQQPRRSLRGGHHLGSDARRRPAPLMRSPAAASRGRDLPASRSSMPASMLRRRSSRCNLMT